MKPRYSIGTYVHIGIRDRKYTFHSVTVKPCISYFLRSRCYLYVPVLYAALACSAYATEVVIKVVSNAVFVAADSKASEDGDSFGVCKIIEIEPRRQYFSFSGNRGGPYYDIGQKARSSLSADLSDTARRFVSTVINDMTNYAKANHRIGESSFARVAFYGIERGKPLCIKLTFLFPVTSNGMTFISERCPPECRDLISLGDADGSFINWLSEHPFMTSSPIPKRLDCLVRLVMVSEPGVGGEVSIAKIDTFGLNWVNGQNGACETGPHEQRSPLATNPKPCTSDDSLIH